MQSTVNEYDYFQRIGKAWDESDIKKKHPEWAWSLAATQLYTDSLVIVGFNWGAATNEQYEPQVILPDQPWPKQDLGSLSRTIPYLRKHFPDVDLDQVVQTNYCFFRSHEESEISSRDLKLCDPICHDLLQALRPRQVLIFSSRLRDRILPQLTQVKEAEITSGNRKPRAIRAQWTIGGRPIPVGIIPHPNNAITGEAREACWEWISDKS